MFALLLMKSLQHGSALMCVYATGGSKCPVKLGAPDFAGPVSGELAERKDAATANLGNIATADDQTSILCL